MNLLPTEEQTLVIQAISATLEKLAPFQRLFGTTPDTGRDILLKAAAEGSWYGLSLPEQVGGVGYSIVEEALLARELGRTVAPLAIQATALAAHGAHLAEEAKLAAQFGQAEIKAGFAIALGGDRLLVLDPTVSGYALLLGDETRLLDTGKLKLCPCTCLDPTTDAAQAQGYDDAIVLRVNDSEILQRARLLIAAQMVGLAEKARDLAVEHAGTRVQFGRPIGAFQAVKHRCSDMATRCELAWAQICACAATLNEGGDDAGLQSASAYMVADDAAVTAIRGAIQIHGGMGVTAEHALHVLLKRYHVLTNLGGGAGLEKVFL